MKIPFANGRRRSELQMSALLLNMGSIFWISKAFSDALINRKMQLANYQQVSWRNEFQRICRN